MFKNRNFPNIWKILPFILISNVSYWMPKDYGNILYTDGKFLELLYAMNGTYFGDKSKYKNAVDDIKNNIYDFIRSSYKTVLVVDCENSDAYKLYGMLKNLNYYLHLRPHERTEIRDHI